MTLFRIVPVAALMASGLVSGGALAETKQIDARGWREIQPKYEFVHPMTVTCQQFIDAEAIYRPYVVAWLSGRMLGVVDMADPETFVPVSVPQVVTTCTESPEDMVFEVIAAD